MLAVADCEPEPAAASVPLPLPLITMPPMALSVDSGAATG